MVTTATTRRVFLLQLASAGGAAMAMTNEPAPAPGSRVEDKDAQAIALGYVSDTGKADQKKYPKHTADQKCSNCQLYQGKAGEPAGPCPLFGTKKVAAGGWCGSWVKKA